MILEQKIEISIIIPVFNEQESLVESSQQIKKILESTRKKYEMIFINDGSTDHSAMILEEIYQHNKGLIRVIHFSRNFGHQLALTAGLHQAKGRAAIIMDADLQDPPELIQTFIDKWEEGFEIVYGMRKAREGESFFKKATAALFYKLMRATTAIDLPENVGDFYLLDRKVVDVINSFRERHRFMRGLVAWAGFKRFGVDYVRKPRFKGQTKYSFSKMLTFSIDAITSFSFTPLHFVSWLGAIFSFLSFFYIIIIIFQRLFTDTTITGWASIMASVLFIGGIQLMALGIIGEYLARIGDDVKSRPLYTIAKICE